MNSPGHAQLMEKLRRGRPVAFSADEAALLGEALRDAMAITLSVDRTLITGEAKVFDDLGLDSIDVFDILEQLGERFEIQVALEEMPNDVVHGGEGATFDHFAERLLNYFRAPPAPRPPPSGP